MHGKRAHLHPDSLIVGLAELQHGVVHRRQLLERGLSPDAIDARITTGFLHPIHRGVYAVGRRKLTGPGHYVAAVFALGEGAVLSHHSAAAHQNLRASLSSKVAVTVPTRNGRKGRAGITVHRCAIHPWETEIVDEIRTTTVARTLVDLAEVFPRRVVERALDEAEQLGELDLDAIAKVIAAHPGRIGAKRLARILATHTPGTTATDEGVEEDFLAIIGAHSLPRPEVHADIWVEGRTVPYEADFLWRAHRLIAETDGGKTHRTGQAFEDDRAKTNALTLAGYTVLRFTYNQVTKTPDAVAGQVRAALAAYAP